MIKGMISNRKRKGMIKGMIKRNDFKRKRKGMIKGMIPNGKEKKWASRQSFWR